MKCMLEQLVISTESNNQHLCVKSLSLCAEYYFEIISTLPEEMPAFPRFYCPFLLCAFHTPVTQRGCSDALISHTGRQHRGQHTRTKLPVSSLCLSVSMLYSPLINAPSGLLANPISLFVRISLCGFSEGQE